MWVDVNPGPIVTWLRHLAGLEPLRRQLRVKPSAVSVIVKKSIVDGAVVVH